MLAHFGLGDATKVDSVEIEWPSGTVQQLHNLPVRKFLTITEPVRLDLGLKEGAAHLVFRAGKDFTFALETSEDLISWVSVRTNTATGLQFEFEDSDAQNHHKRFYRTRMP